MFEVKQISLRPGLDTSSKTRWYDPLWKLNSYLYSKRNSKGETTSNNTSCNHFIESFLVLKIPQRPTTIKTLACPTTFHTRKIISVMYFSTISQHSTILRYIFSILYITTHCIFYGIDKDISLVLVVIKSFFFFFYLIACTISIFRTFLISFILYSNTNKYFWSYCYTANKCILQY